MAGWAGRIGMDGAGWVLLAEPAALLVALLAIGWALTSRPRGRGR